MRRARIRLAGLAATVGCLAGAPAAPAGTLSMSSYFGGTQHDQIGDVANCSDGLLAAFGSGAPPSSSAGTTSSPAGTSGAAGTGSAGGEQAAPIATRRLSVSRRGRRLSGRLFGDGCTAGARLLLERRARSGWRVVRRARTRADGRFALRLPQRAGRYRLRAPCAAVRSRVISLG